MVVGLLRSWGRSVRRSLERPDSAATRRRRDSELAPRWLPLPAGRTGSVTAKDLGYLVREPRRLVAAITGTLLPVLAFSLGPVALSGSRPPPGLVYAVIGIGLLGALGTSNRFGFDGSVVWGLILLVVGPLYGLGLGVLIRRYAARIWAERGPEVLFALSAGRS